MGEPNAFLENKTGTEGQARALSPCLRVGAQPSGSQHLLSTSKAGQLCSDTRQISSLVQLDIGISSDAVETKPVRQQLREELHMFLHLPCRERGLMRWGPVPYPPNLWACVHICKWVHTGAALTSGFCQEACLSFSPCFLTSLQARQICVPSGKGVGRLTEGLGQGSDGTALPRRWLSH